VDAWQWKPDMIWFDNLNVVRTPNYYVQQMYAQNSGTKVLQVKNDGMNITGQDGLYGSSSINEVTSEIIVKVVNASADVKEITINLKGLKNSVQNKKVDIFVLHSAVPEAVNTLEKPNNVVPVRSFIKADASGFTLKAQANAFYVCKLKIK
jgi:alpha-L-arabinofuranosidase